jgi:hypothetical protein
VSILWVENHLEVKKYFEEHGQTFKTALSAKVVGGGVIKLVITKVKGLIIGAFKKVLGIEQS